MQNQTESSGSKEKSAPRQDEILTELWETKSRLNLEANYSLDALVAQARKASETFTKQARRIDVG
jgi:DNA polymerase elongation subunit (family B)